ncbi:hypothetical protein Tco_0800513 [Tanacetum coccineum]|uniref:Uncharacterized protein n=1 Tax=Tanacetum coccineum TaxID=301880 RepID=A0ABQ4ZUA8_9ASTR
MQTTISLALLKDRPTMLGPGKILRWHSRFPYDTLTTKSNVEYLRSDLIEGPYMPYKRTHWQAFEAAENILASMNHIEEAETIHNMTSRVTNFTFKLKKKLFSLILTGIGMKIYSTVDACNTSKEDVDRPLKCYKQGESETYFKTQPEWSRFVTVVKQETGNRYSLISQVFDVLSKFQKRSNDIRSERHQNLKDRMQQSYMQSSKCVYQHKAKRSPTMLLLNLSPFPEEHIVPEQARRIKDMNKTEDTTPRYKNDNQSGQFGNQRTMTVDGAREIVVLPEATSGIKDYSYHKEKMMMCKQAEQGVPLQADWLADTDEEIDE